jgi:hypothetical protein
LLKNGDFLCLLLSTAWSEVAERDNPDKKEDQEKRAANREAFQTKIKRDPFVPATKNPDTDFMRIYLSGSQNSRLIQGLLMSKATTPAIKEEE